MKKKNIEKLNNMKVGEKLVTKKYTYEVCKGHCDGNCVGLYEEDCCFYESDINCTRIISCTVDSTVDNIHHYFRRTENTKTEEKDNLTKLIDLIEDNLNNDLPRIKSL